MFSWDQPRKRLIHSMFAKSYITVLLLWQGPVSLFTSLLGTAFILKLDPFRNTMSHLHSPALGHSCPTNTRRLNKDEELPCLCV